MLISLAASPCAGPLGRCPWLRHGQCWCGIGELLISQFPVESLAASCRPSHATRMHTADSCAGRRILWASALLPSLPCRRSTQAGARLSSQAEPCSPCCRPARGPRTFLLRRPVPSSSALESRPPSSSPQAWFPRVSTGVLPFLSPSPRTFSAACGCRRGAFDRRGAPTDATPLPTASPAFASGP